MLAVHPRTAAKLVRKEGKRMLKHHYISTIVLTTTLLLVGLKLYNAYMLMRPSARV